MRVYLSQPNPNLAQCGDCFVSPPHHFSLLGNQEAAQVLQGHGWGAQRPAWEGSGGEIESTANKVGGSNCRALS